MTPEILHSILCSTGGFDMALVNKKDASIRKINKTGDYSYYVTIPKEYIDKLKWRKGQKITVDLEDDNIILKDWKK